MVLWCAVCANVLNPVLGSWRYSQTLPLVCLANQLRLQWNLSYLATMGPDHGQLSKTSGCESQCIHICDRLWEKVHFRAKCNIELRVKRAESWQLAVKLDHDAGQNYSLSSTFSHWSDVRAPLLALTASSQRCKVKSRRTCTVRVNNQMCGVNTSTIRVTKETLWINNMASRADTATMECSACAK